MHELPDIAWAPFVVRLTAGEDFIACAFKSTASNLFLYGIYVDKLREWKKPTGDKDVSEEQLFSGIKLSSEMRLGAVELADTETCKLKTMLEEVRKLCPTFNKQTPKVISVKLCDAWAGRNMTKNATQAVLKAEARDRGGASSKAAKAKDDEVSKDGGSDAKLTWSEVLKMLKEYFKYYDVPFDERFIAVQSDADIDQVKAQLEWALCTRTNLVP